MSILIWIELFHNVPCSRHRVLLQSVSLTFCRRDTAESSDPIRVLLGFRLLISHLNFTTYPLSLSYLRLCFVCRAFNDATPTTEAKLTVQPFLFLNFPSLLFHHAI